MNQKELNEIRRRLALDKNTITKIYGCYVNTDREIITTIEEPLTTLTESEAQKYLGLLKKSLSGALSKNLMDIEFSNEQIKEGEEYKNLLALYECRLKDDTERAKLFKTIIDAYDPGDSNYLILLASDAYDVPYKASDDTVLEDSSESVFTYIVCAICPVKDSKSELGYSVAENTFRSRLNSQVVSNTEVGFMYPTFDNRATNLYNALYYAKDPSVIHQELIDALFKSEIPMSAPEQQETFTNVLTESLQEDFDFDVVQSVHEQLRERIIEHKESKAIEPLDLTVNEVGGILENSGLSKEKVEIFKEKCNEQFGDDAHLKPEILIDSKKFNVVTPQVKISVSPDFTYAVETRIIDGRKYILIPADEGIEVNGVEVNIPNE